MLSFLKSRMVLTSMGLALVALFIWVFGPLLELKDWKPFGSVPGRLAGIALVFVWYAAWKAFERLKARRAGDQLAAAVVKTSQGERPSADVVQLRERFEEAVATLKQQKRSGHSLYELPWYVIIGAPGAGKTTALVNSGLHFPLEQRSGKGALRGVGGTRNCDWWFTDEAILLDTAGRYTTQDSDASADSAGWAEFLALLRKYRKRRPLNGVILAISAHDLMVQGQAGREAHVAATRRRLNELNKELRVQLPVYVLVTKCDLVSGFAEYFDDVAQEGRTQVWGVTFPYEVTQSGGAPAAFPAEFDGLMQRLNERVWARLEDDRDVRRRSKIFAFPQQMAAMREALSGFVSDVFESTRFDQVTRLRGVYFTSGTQEGTPIDRLLGALGRRFAVPAEAVVPAGRGKAYFIERLLKNVMLAESGLAGVNRRVEIQKAAAQLGAYLAMALVALLGVVALWHSYGVNRSFLTTFGQYAGGLSQTLAGAVSDQSVLPRLDGFQSLVVQAEAFPKDVSWFRRGWGLNQGPWVADAAKDAYSSEVRNALLKTMTTRIAKRLAVAGDPVELYQYLRAYLMLSDPQRLGDRAQLQEVADQEWKSIYGSDTASAARLSEHFARLLEAPLPGGEIDKELVRNARAKIPPESIPRLVFSLAKVEYRRNNPQASPPLQGLIADQVFTRKGGGSLAQSVPSFYTKDAFSSFQQQIDTVLQRFDAEWWIWEDVDTGRMRSKNARQIVLDEYEQEYIRTWDGALGSVGFVSITNLDSARNALRAVAGSNSALRQLLMTVDQHTFLVPAMAKAPGIFATVRDTLVGAYSAATAWVAGNKHIPGAQITAYFAPIHALLVEDKGKAPIDALLEQIRNLEAKLQLMGGGVVGGDSSTGAVAGVSQASDSLKRDAAGLPGSAAAVGAMVAEISSAAVKASSADLSTGLRDKHRELMRQCTLMIENRYPFAQGAGAEVTPADFARLFGQGGLFDTFITKDLGDLVQVSGQSVAWKTLPSGESAGAGLFSLRPFASAHRIREGFFAGGGNQLRVVFFIVFTRAEAKANAVEVEIDGKLMTYRFEPERRNDVTWPGAKPGPASVTFVEAGNRRVPIATEGLWAWFKLIDQGELTQQTSDRFTLIFRKPPHSVEMRIEAGSVHNPFGIRDVLRGFNCSGG